MIYFIFTLDYEIFGDGTGGLREFVLEPAQRLMDIFRTWNARFVAYVEVAEFEKIEQWNTDPAIGEVTKQIGEFHREGFEVGLHLHPQWCNASYQEGKWLLDISEYNLCTLPRERISEIVKGALAYLRKVVGDPSFTPLCFRAGNWLFQPTRDAADVLRAEGIRVDSSVFKGGLQRGNGLDYRSAMKNGQFWAFHYDVTKPDASGDWIEVPIYTEMVPFWKMATVKRLSANRRKVVSGQRRKRKWNRAMDYARFRYPKKLDFCRMTLDELTSMMDRILEEDRRDPQTFRPIVAIGHTKDPIDFNVVESFLRYLRTKRITISTFSDIYPQLSRTIPAEKHLARQVRAD